MAQENTKETLKIANILNVKKNGENAGDPLLVVLTEEKEIITLNFSDFNKENNQAKLDKFIRECDGINNENELLELHQNIVNKQNYHDHIELKCDIFINQKVCKSFPVVTIDDLEMKYIFAYSLPDLMELTEAQRITNFAFNMPALNAANVCYIFYI